MYRLACYDAADYKKEDVRYIQTIVSETISRGLRYVLEEQGTTFFSIFMESSFQSGFFCGLSQYVSMKNDEDAGAELVRHKARRMLEKVEDPQQDYVFDVFEELLLYLAIMQCKDFFRLSKAHMLPFPFYDLNREKQVAAELVEKYQYHTKNAEKISRDILRFHQMNLKRNQDSNIVFWDDDYLIVFHNGFVEGIRFLKSFAGENAGYGYDSACAIFTDIGMKAPIRLLGTKEANRIANEVSRQKAMEALESVLPETVSGIDFNEEDLPFN